MHIDQVAETLNRPSREREALITKLLLGTAIQFGGSCMHVRINQREANELRWNRPIRKISSLITAQQSTKDWTDAADLPEVWIQTGRVAVASDAIRTDETGQWWGVRQVYREYWLDGEVQTESGNWRLEEYARTPIAPRIVKHIGTKTRIVKAKPEREPRTRLGLGALMIQFAPELNAVDERMLIGIGETISFGEAAEESFKKMLWASGRTWPAHRRRPKRRINSPFGSKPVQKAYIY